MTDLNPKEHGMPLSGILNTARSLSYYLRWQEVTANNLANTNTDAFKADRIAALGVAKLGYATPVERTSLEQGSFRDTGRPLDVSLDGPGFLVVQTAHGERLTRGGSLRLDAAGVLTDGHGDPVLGEQGPIVLSGAEVEVRSDGSILVDGAIAGKLRLETVEEPATLLKEGFGRFVPATALEPVAEGSMRVRQGAIEEPNMDPLLSMVDMITIQRAYAANVDALRAMDGVLGVVTGEVGKV
jgi:flagellar basal body rod protein FlgG